MMRNVIDMLSVIESSGAQATQAGLFEGIRTELDKVKVKCNCNELLQGSFALRLAGNTVRFATVWQSWRSWQRRVWLTFFTRLLSTQ